MKHRTISVIIAAALLLVPALVRAAAAVQTDVPETKQERDVRMAWWREAKFGLFIHWGVYSVPAGYYHGKSVGGGEWIMNHAKIPMAEYQQFAKEFNPVQFNAEEWVKIAKDAGMKYIVITAKHHDGFAMFHSQASRFNIYDATPFHRDPLKELAAACARAGIKLGFYYSQAQDWNHPGGAASGGHWDPAQDGDMDKFIDTVDIPQIRELFSNYGKVAVIWWDTPIGMTPERAQKILPLLQMQPGIISNNRLDAKKITGDYGTPENKIPTNSLAMDWETCMTMNGTWGYMRDDNNWKSTSTLLRNLIDIASKGGNYLLNVGPTSEGLIPQASMDRLAEIGQWLRVNGEAIYGTSPTVFGAEAGAFSQTETNRNGSPRFVPAWEWRCTTKPGKVYIHLFKWPSGKFEVTGLKNKVTGACLLADAAHTALEITQTDQTVSVSLPQNAPDPIASVLCLDVVGKPSE